MFYQNSEIKPTEASLNSKISRLRGREVLDSKGMATVEVEMETSFGKFSASSPSGVSTGRYEAVELRDEDGRGVKKAIESIEKVIFPALEKEELDDQERIDEILIRLDGTKNKSRLGANAILPVSMAVCRAISSSQNLPLYRYISQLSEDRPLISLPKPSFNMVEGGKHATNTLAFQEFMAVPQKESFKENLEIGIKIYQELKDILEKKYGKENIALSREGAFSAQLKEISKPFDLILEAAENSGLKSDIKLAIDAAASSFFESENYKVDGKILKKEELVDFYQKLLEKYPIMSLEDPFAEEDFGSWKRLKSETLNLKHEILIFGDDLTATNLERIKLAKEKDLCNGLILKPNQIGTVTETLRAAKLARSYGWKIMVSNRAGETEDDFIADLAVGIGADFIKSGAPFPKERMAKYNRLVRIEEELRSATKFSRHR